MANKSFIGTDGGSWNTAGNWSPSGVPIAGDVAYLTRSITAAPHDAVNPSDMYHDGLVVNTADHPTAWWRVSNTNAGAVDGNTWYLPAGGGTVDVFSSTPYTLGSNPLPKNVLLAHHISAGTLTKTGNAALTLNVTRDWPAVLNIQGGLVSWGGGTGGTYYDKAGTTINLSDGAMFGPYTINGGMIAPTINVNGAVGYLVFNAESANNDTMRIRGILNIGANTLIVHVSSNVTNAGFTSNISSGGFYSNMTGTGFFIKRGGGTLHVDENAGLSFTGVVRCEEGVLNFARSLDAADNPNSAPRTFLSAAFDTSGAGTVNMPPDVYIGALIGSGNRSFSGTNVILGNGRTDTRDWSGAFTSNIGVVKYGSGTQRFSSFFGSARTSAQTYIHNGTIEVATNTAFWSPSATGYTEISGSNSRLSIFGNTSVPSGVPISILDHGTIHGVAFSPVVAGPITLSSTSNFTAESGVTLTLNSLNLNAQIANFNGPGKVKLNVAPTNGGGIRSNSGGTLDITSISATVNSVGGDSIISGSVSVSSGGSWRSGNGAGGRTLTLTGNLTTAGTSNLYSDGVASGIASKFAVGGALTTGGAITVRGSGGGWQSNTEYLIATYGSGTPNVNTTAGSWSSTTNGRIGNGTVRLDTVNKQILLSPVSTLSLGVTWDGGTGGLWYAGQPNGWFSGSATQSFENNDTVTFSNARSTATSTVSGTVTAAAITFTNSSGVNSQTITGSGTIINNGALAITNNGGAYSLFLEGAARHGAINIIQGATSDTNLYIRNINALSGSGTITSTINGGGSPALNVFFQSGSSGLSISRNWSLPPAASQVLDVAFATEVTLSGLFTKTGANPIIKNGLGTLTLNAINSFAAPLRVAVGKIIAAKKSALGAGQLNLRDATVQCTDTVTDPAKLASVSSFTTSGATGLSRLVLGQRVERIGGTIQITGNLNISNGITIELSPNIFNASGTWTLLAWTGTLTGSANNITVDSSRTSFAAIRVFQEGKTFKVELV